MSGRVVVAVATLSFTIQLSVLPAAAEEQETKPSDVTCSATSEGATTDRPDRVTFHGVVTVKDSPIVEGTKTDPFGSLVTTVSDQQIDDLYAQDLTAALRRVPGVVISRYNPVGSFGGGDGGAFFIRGHGSSRPGGEIMMLSDGIPRFVGIWTHPLIDLATMDTVHQVDIYRSAQPVLLGNMAFGAVDMASKRRTMSGSGGRFVGSYGTYDTIIGSLEYGGLTENFDYYLTAGHRQSDGHSIYANWAHAFNPPGVYAAVQYGGWGRGETWQDLEVETLDHMEVGWLGSLNSSVRVSASLFHDQVDNAIRFVPPPPPPPEFANIGAYTVNGLEVSVNANASRHVALFVGGTVSDADPATVPNLPKTTAVGGMTWNSARDLRLNVDIQWIDDRYILNPRYAACEVAVSSYFLANAKLGIPLRWLGVRAEGSIFVFGENLTDEDYEYRIGYPMPGRMIQAGLDLEF